MEENQKKLTLKILKKWKTQKLLSHLEDLREVGLLETQIGDRIQGLISDREVTIWVDNHTTRVLRAGVEYHLREPLGKHPVRQMFIGYESALMSRGMRTPIVQVTRWLPGVYQTAIATGAC